MNSLKRQLKKWSIGGQKTHENSDQYRYFVLLCAEKTLLIYWEVTVLIMRNIVEKNRMRKCIFIFTLFFSVCSYAAKGEKLVLTDTSIGNMPIGVGADISLYKIRNFFPHYKVTHEIREGDSPDYNLFTVSNYEGEELLYFISYINQPDDYEKGVVKLHEVIVHSPG